MNITYEDYSKLSDNILLLGLNIVLKLNVSLYSTDANGHRYPCHREYNYYNKDSILCASIQRSYDYFLSIENIKPLPTGEKEFIRIGLPELFKLRNALQHVIDWFMSEEYIGLFAYTETKELVIDKSVDAIMIDKLPMGKFISFEPVVISYNDMYTEGVRLYLNSNDNYTDIPFNRFTGFVELINRIDIFCAAQNLLNYLGRPAYGTNSVTIGSRFK